MIVRNLRLTISCCCKHLQRTLLLHSARNASRDTEVALVDYTEVVITGGQGGMGCASIHHLSARSKTKPDGADGGSGGAIFFKCSRKYMDLGHIPSEIAGRAGSHGSGSNRRGQPGKDTVIPVPLGSIIGDSTSQTPLVQLTKEGQLFRACKGGLGGRGNSGISEEREQGYSRYMCREKEDGKEGEEARLFLEMKIIADVGLVGLPNAGKSSLLRAISAAKPKVASYPFTTMRPHVGIVHFEGYNRVRMADIPGLIEGSSLGRGLGFSFLKHIERCQSILVVVDMTNTRYSPVETITLLEQELHAYKEEMNGRIIGIVANKIDLMNSPEPILELAKAFPQYPVMPLSALEQRNIVAVRKIIEPYKTLHKPGDDNSDEKLFC